MQLLDDRLILAASDLIDHLECAHLTHLDLEVAVGRLALEATRTDAADLVAHKGEEHELAIRCRTAEQMRLVNALCRLVEVAEEQAEPAGGLTPDVDAGA
jgi:hypothetical protein